MPLCAFDRLRQSNLMQPSAIMNNPWDLSFGGRVELEICACIFSETKSKLKTYDCNV